MAIIEGAGVDLSVMERGSGPPVLLIHGMAADSGVWGGVADPLAERARVIAYDRRGYGGSGAPEPYERTTIEEQAEDAAALLRSLDAAPAVVGAADLGALVALDLVRRHRDLVAGAVLLEPPLFQFVPEATEVLAERRAELEAALREAGPAKAVETWLYAEGVDDPDRRARARERPGAFFADYGAIAGLAVTRRELRSLEVPVVVVVRPEAGLHVVAAARALVELVPRARLVSDGDVGGALSAVLADVA
jgi:pimeloyl-ACP methyl ester carboxylesterase